MSHPKLDYLKRFVKQNDPKEEYKVLACIGSGTYGDVFKAIHRETRQTVAVKIMRIDMKDDIRAICQEIHTLRECTHPNIVQFYGSYLRNNKLWICMEYCGGQSMQDIYFATRRPLDEDCIAFVSRETLQGLNFMHLRGRIHRDIKGANILLTDNGNVKVADFGVAAQLNNTIGKRTTLIGTPYWMAPEVASIESRSTGYDGKCDVWGVGITAIEYGELQPPMFDLDPRKALQLLGTRNYKPPVLQDRSRWSQKFHSFVKCCLVKNERRRPDAQTMLTHLFVINPNLSTAMTQRLLIYRRQQQQQHPPDEPPKQPPVIANQNGDARVPINITHLPISDVEPLSTFTAIFASAVAQPEHHFPQQTQFIASQQLVLVPESRTADGDKILMDNRTVPSATIKPNGTTQPEDDQSTLTMETRKLNLLELADRMRFSPPALPPKQGTKRPTLSSLEDPSSDAFSHNGSDSTATANTDKRNAPMRPVPPVLKKVALSPPPPVSDNSMLSNSDLQLTNHRLVTKRILNSSSEDLLREVLEAVEGGKGMLDSVCTSPMDCEQRGHRSSPYDNVKQPLLRHKSNIVLDSRIKPTAVACASPVHADHHVPSTTGRVRSKRRAPSPPLSSDRDNEILSPNYCNSMSETSNVEPHDASVPKGSNTSTAAFGVLNRKACNLNDDSRSGLPRLPKVHMGACFTTLFQGCPLKVNTTATWVNPETETQVILFGTNDGIYYLDLENLADGTLELLISRRCIWLSVLRDTMMSICGPHPQLYSHNLVSLIKVKGGTQSKLLHKRFQPTTKVPDTRGCYRANVIRNPYNGMKYLCGVVGDSIVVMEWYNPRNTFIEVKRVAVSNMPSPVLNFDLVISQDQTLPLVCLGVFSTYDPLTYKLHLVNLNDDKSGLEKMSNLLLVKPEDKLQVIKVIQMEYNTLLLCFPSHATIVNLDGQVKANREGWKADLQFGIDVQSVVCLSDSVLAFHIHGLKGIGFDGQLTQDINDETRVYSLLGSDKNVIVESRPSDDPMSSSNILLLAGHKDLF